tara:strand:- start:22720 stop:23781 length:1062 start_codon:yes stop_codon:yes gene_type:complete
MTKNIAIIGCGKIFAKHYEAIKLQEKKKKLKLIAVCDKDKKILNKINLKNVNKYNNIRQLFKNEKIDIISILTPSGFHYQDALKCLGKVKSIIIEKPVTLKYSHAQKLLKLSKKKGTNIHVVLQNRFNDPIIELKKAIENNLFGKLFLATVRLRWSRGLNYYTQSKWRGTWELDGGVVANQSSHFIDLFQWLFGMPTKVFSRIRQMHKIKKEVEDTSLSIFEYKENKKLGLIEATNAIRPHNLEGSISIVGEKGTVIVGGMSGEKLDKWTLKKNNKITKLLKDKFKKKNGHIKFYEYMINNLNNESKFLSLEEGMKSLKIINSIYKSSLKNMPIDVKNVKDSFLGNNKKKNES